MNGSEPSTPKTGDLSAQPEKGKLDDFKRVCCDEQGGIHLRNSNQSLMKTF